MNTVQPGAFLTLHYRLSGSQGVIIDTFGGAPATLSLGTGALAPVIEARLIGLPEGAHEVFEFAPGEVFGQRREEMVQRLSAEELRSLGDPQATYAVGDVLHLPTPDGTGRFAAVVREVAADGTLRLDFNHPLAGQAVRFEVEIAAVLNE